MGNDVSQVWDQSAWLAFERRTAREVAAAARPELAWARAVRASRFILRTYSTSFFIVTRFLPPAKRGQVEVVYAAVRYPDEIVDTFPIPPAERLRLLDQWAEDYERGLEYSALQRAVGEGLNPFIAGFAQVVREKEIPPQHYRSFLEAMRLDVAPRPFLDLEDLVESYIYGSATVVGYFLAYVYGASAPSEFQRALTASRDLGIALQLTNFLRDVPEDKRRGRVYLPQDMLRAEGIADLDFAGESSRRALRRVLRQLSDTAEQFYSNAESNLDAFSPDCRVAIHSCIEVYRQLNQRIGSSTEGVLHRESVPMKEKFRVLPPSKYWRLPLAYLGAL
jgi:phytoene synthase